MLSLDQISSDLKLLESKRQELRKTLEQLRPDQSLGLKWKELENLSFSIKSTMQTCLKELKSKEEEIIDRLKKLEVRENEVNLRSKELGLKLIDCRGGERMLLFLNDHENELEEIADEVYCALQVSADPAILVLDAISKGFSLQIEKGIVRRSTVLLLEQLMRVKPKIGKGLRKRGTRLAKEWKSKMGEGDEEEDNGVEVLGFLMLLGVYGLVCEFDLMEIRSLFESVSHHKQAPELRRALGLVDKTTESGSSLLSQEKIEQSLIEDLSLDNQLPSQVKLDRYMASSSLSCWPELKSFCIGMDGRGLVSFLCQHTEEHDFMCSAVSDALELAPDPAKLVLDVLPGFHRSNDYFKGLPLPNVRRSCILLLEQLMTVSLQIEPSVSEEALKLAIDWKEKVAQKYPTAVTVYGLLQFIVTYRLVSAFDAYELVGFLVRASEHKQSPDLCLALGLEDKIPILIENLLKKPLMLEAMEYICAFELFSEFPPARILKAYWRYNKKRIYKGKKSRLTMKQAIEREIETVRAIIKCIIDHRLESHCSPEELENYILELEKQKTIGNDSVDQKHNIPAPFLKAQARKVAPTSETALNLQPSLQHLEGLYAHQTPTYLSSFARNYGSGTSGYVAQEMGSFGGAYRVDPSTTLFNTYTMSPDKQHGSGTAGDWNMQQFGFPGTEYGTFTGFC